MTLELQAGWRFHLIMGAQGNEESTGRESFQGEEVTSATTGIHPSGAEPWENRGPVHFCCGLSLVFSCRRRLWPTHVRTQALHCYWRRSSPCTTRRPQVLHWDTTRGLWGPPAAHWALAGRFPHHVKPAGHRCAVTSRLAEIWASRCLSSLFELCTWFSN